MWHVWLSWALCRRKGEKGLKKPFLLYSATKGYENPFFFSLYFPFPFCLLSMGSGWRKGSVLGRGQTTAADVGQNSSNRHWKHSNTSLDVSGRLSTWAPEDDQRSYQSLGRKRPGFSTTIGGSPTQIGSKSTILNGWDENFWTKLKNHKKR